MPTYDYRCNACGHQFEEFQSITSEPIRLCPVCGEEQVTRLLSGGTGLIFKGSGFYITDYKDKKNGSSNGESSTTSKPKKETKTESKSDKAS